MKQYLPLLFLFCATLLNAQTRQEDKQLEILYRMLHESEVFSEIFTGFSLYDPEQERFLMEKDAGKYFTPASNTKILTLYTALKVLGDSIPAFRYATTGDSMIIWGTADPMFLHPDLPADATGFSLLQDTSCQLFFSAHNYKDERFGPGWAWDDYSYGFQPEKSSFPLYGNQVYFYRTETGEGIQAYPGYFERQLAYNPNIGGNWPSILRAESGNTFEFNDPALSGFPFEQFRPFNVTPQLITQLLTDTLNKPVGELDLTHLPPMPVKTHHRVLPDTLYRKLMQDSDNFIAEQLLLACSEKLFGSQSTADAIRYAQDSLYRALPDRLLWRDGSGLSRYNLFTPRTMVGVLDLIRQEKPAEWRHSVFATGGVSGTIEDLYAGAKGKPYLFAKTGTLSNKHCLSGYLITNTGRELIFSFMNNNYVQGTAPVKKEMQQVLEYIRDQF
ncbi:MAG: D-alanyl-D-alanine carboxypeptidase [Phaeodactylibacter sp.]|uniref:D-alanyl-D-alanine carboxypeptidase/D-alanyl-D-alanine-endopeptidase n=1 Tax=Phaeodactylibacter sp. TaxID=1940289 RepID=UPI0032EBE17A